MGSDRTTASLQQEFRRNTPKTQYATPTRNATRTHLSMRRSPLSHSEESICPSRKPSRGAQTPLRRTISTRISTTKNSIKPLDHLPSIRPLRKNRGMRKKEGERNLGGGKGEIERGATGDGAGEDVCDTTARASPQGSHTPSLSAGGRAAQPPSNPEDPLLFFPLSMKRGKGGASEGEVKARKSHMQISEGGTRCGGRHTPAAELSTLRKGIDRRGRRGIKREKTGDQN